ncbi:MAG: hypothetical protein ACLUJR_04495 [Mediterraneibacter gnavus]
MTYRIFKFRTMITGADKEARLSPAVRTIV